MCRPWASFRWSAPNTEITFSWESFCMVLTSRMASSICALSLHKTSFKAYTVEYASSLTLYTTPKAPFPSLCWTMNTCFPTLIFELVGRVPTACSILAYILQANVNYFVSYFSLSYVDARNEFLRKHQVYLIYLQMSCFQELFVFSFEAIRGIVWKQSYYLELSTFTLEPLPLAG